MQGFWDRTGSVFESAEKSEGYLGRAIFDETTSAYNWGAWTSPPAFDKEEYTNRRPSTLSLWKDLESVFAFSYYGLHAEALGKRREWFEKLDTPIYVAWWVGDDHIPNWQEASERHDLLRREGSTPAAFDLKNPFNPDGKPVQVDREAVKNKWKA